jgi:transcriptional regulator with XRE-family HTH domain
MWQGDALRRAREGLGVTQETLSVAAGVEQTQISQWERGTEPTGRNLVKLVEGLNAIGRKAGRRFEFHAIEFYGVG